MFSQCHHNRVVDFQYLNRGHRNNRLCPYNVFSALLCVPFLWFLHVATYLSYSSPSLSPSSAAVTTAVASTRSNNSFYHHLVVTHAPDLHTVSSKMSIIGCVTIYSATVFYLFRTYAPIYSNPASSIAVSKGGYSQLPFLVALDVFL